eukprot:c8530_g1_i1.p1 GENE.c8530_g1_i1~~c8530_g1_i1.p1  ORF type:complete len:548 (-),score=179.62 c8530_g1_i1:36-1679(-)
MDVVEEVLRGKNLNIASCKTARLKIEEELKKKQGIIFQTVIEDFPKIIELLEKGESLELDVIQITQSLSNALNLAKESEDHQASERYQMLTELMRLIKEHEKAKSTLQLSIQSKNIIKEIKEINELVQKTDQMISLFQFDEATKSMQKINQSLKSLTNIPHHLIELFNQLKDKVNIQQNDFRSSVIKSCPNPTEELSQFILEIEHHLSDQHLHNLLDQTRKLFTDDTFETTKYISTHEGESSVENKQIIERKIFEFPVCNISKAADKIVNLWKENVTNASKCLNNESKKFQLNCVYDSMKVCLALSTLRVSRVYQMPELSMICHNDLMYFSYSSKIIAAIFSDNNESNSSNEEFTKFLLVSSNFQTLAQNIYVHHITHQVENIREIIRNETLESACKILQNQYETLSRAWNVLPLYLKCISLCNNAEIICSVLVNLLFVKGDINEDECQPLKNLFDDIAVIIKKTACSSEIFGQKNEKEEREWTNEYIPSLSRLICLSGLLNTRLIEIPVKWKNQELSVLSQTEVIHMIKSLFSESPKRQTAIASIE